jgi:hypothetical protein
MTENSASTAIQVLREILAQEILYPQAERDKGPFVSRSFVNPSKFNIRHGELLDLMYSFEKIGLLEKLSDNIPIKDLLFKEYDKDGIPLPHVLSPEEKEYEELVNYRIKDIEKIKSFISTLQNSPAFDLDQKNQGVISKNINHVDLSPSDGLQIGSVCIKISKTQYPIIEGLIKAGEKEENSKYIIYKPVETKKLKKPTSSESAFRSLLQQIRKKGIKKGKKIFDISSIKFDKNKSAYCFTAYKVVE